MQTSSIFTAAVSVLVATTFAALPAAAGHVGDKFERRIERQANRIQQGVRSGELTRHEVRHLRDENHKIAHKLRRFIRDGRLDFSERRRMRRLLSVANDNIYAEKHDNERQYARGRHNHGHDRFDRTSNRSDNPRWYNYRRYTNRWF